MFQRRKTIELNYGEYLSYRLKQPLGQGFGGTVYRYDEKNAIKLWYEDTNMVVLEDYRNSVESLLSCKHRCLITPNTLVLMEKEIVGYLFKYFPGIDLKNLDENVKLRILYIAINELRRGISKASSDHFLLDDTHNQNILFNIQNERITLAVADGDTWTKERFKTEYECYHHNIKNINRTILNTILDPQMNNSDQNIQKFIASHQCLELEYNRLIEGLDDNLVNFLQSLILFLQQETKKEIENVGQLRRVLK